jgi:O-acetyl-ADP-ribose deacetylase (regulator of RNase III)
MINYLQGDATEPQTDGNKIIAHICNDVGAWGRGFVFSLTQKYPKSEQDYREWFQGNDETVTIPFKLGCIKFVKVADDVSVANMIAQHGILQVQGKLPPIRYEALEECLRQLRIEALNLNASIHMPRIGCGLAGGKWSMIEPLLTKMLPDISVYVYDFISNDARTIPWTK